LMFLSVKGTPQSYFGSGSRKTRPGETACVT